MPKIEIIIAPEEGEFWREIEDTMAHAYANIDAETKYRKTCLIETSVPKHRQRSDVKIGRAFFINQEWLGEEF